MCHGTREAFENVNLSTVTSLRFAKKIVEILDYATMRPSWNIGAGSSGSAGVCGAHNASAITSDAPAAAARNLSN